MRDIKLKRYLGDISFGNTRWCDVCKTPQSVKGGELIAGKNPNYGKWHCAKCLEKRSDRG